MRVYCAFNWKFKSEVKSWIGLATTTFWRKFQASTIQVLWLNCAPGELVSFMEMLKGAFSVKIEFSMGKQILWEIQLLHLNPILYTSPNFSTSYSLLMRWILKSSGLISKIAEIKSGQLIASLFYSAKAVW